MKKLITYIIGFFLTLFVFELFVNRADKPATVQALTAVKEMVAKVELPGRRKAPRELSPKKLQAWQARVSQVYNRLPTIETTEGRKDFNPHETPTELTTIAIDLADLQGAFEKYPQLENTATQFYDSCIRKADLLPAVRALCLHHMAGVSRVRGREFTYQTYPSDIVRLESNIR